MQKQHSAAENGNDSQHSGGDFSGSILAACMVAPPGEYELKRRDS